MYSLCRRLRPAVPPVCRSYLTISDLHSGSISSASLVSHCLERANSTSSTLNAFVSLSDVDVLHQQAAAADERRARGAPLSPLDGVPITIKDNFCTLDSPTTASSSVLRSPEYRPPYSATPVARLVEGGAILLGRTNMDEFGMGSATAFSTYGPSRNPYLSALTPGGSTGGGAAAVASGAGLLSLGSDTGGSVRQPAAFCGLVGLKPSYGRVSRSGLIAYASSLDCPGFIGRSVQDVAHALYLTAGADGLDQQCRPPPLHPPSSSSDAVASLRGRRIGIPREYHVKELSESTVSLWRQGADWLRDAGAEVVEVSLPHTRYALQAYYVIASAEAASNLARYDGVRYGYRADYTPPVTAFDEAGDASPVGDASALHESYTKTRSEGFGAEVQRRILVGSYVLSESARADYFDSAVRVRDQIRSDFDTVFQSEKIDALLTPTTPTGPWAVDDTSKVDALAMYLNDIMTVPASLAGLPAMSLPVGFSPSTVDSSISTPTGLQLIGQRFQEPSLLSIGSVLESYADFQPPSSVTGEGCGVTV